MKRRILPAILSLALMGGLAAPALAVPADPTRYTDAAQIEHWEAVATLSQLGILDGKPDGSFDPAGTVTRAEAAKMAYLLMNGGKEPPLSNTTTPFSDCAGGWAEGYIAYCADLGIIAGNGYGAFEPDAPVSGLAFGKMCLTMLGYRANAYSLIGESWAVWTDELAKTATPSLYTQFGRVDLSQPITRDNAAQMVYNVLQNRFKVIGPTVDTVTGHVMWNFQSSDQIFLNTRFGLDALPDIPDQP